MNIYKWRCLKMLENQVTRSNHILCLGRTFCYRSSYCSLDKLYPRSSLKLYTPESRPPLCTSPDDPSQKFSGYIPVKDLEIKYCCSSGPGGQHVNKVHTKVDVRFHVKNASWISDEIKEKLLIQERNRINKEGFLVVKSDLTRSQQLNLADALQKIRQMVRNVIVVPAEPSDLTIEKQRKSEQKAAQERLFVKRKRSLIMESRRCIINNDDL